ncbi:hypothetical protein I6F26_24845 [Ensifer sp. IC3342]|nr:hypothetical protein [Ensifer sp. IC4062]MCA1408221.1 hypothetical protein [Ensifer sp. BRP08]MCA1440816.1 hypothetical protein [Ensifer sp. IC4062]MCA1449791.1 hypothetical protein [Ensifer sp. IC3342]
MAFVVDEQVVYIDSRVYEALRDASGSLFDRALAASAVLFSLSTAGNTRTGYVIGTYAVVPREAPEVRQFCEAGASPPSGTWIEKLTTALCKSPDMSKNVPSMNVSFVQGPVCENAGFVACGEPDKKVSLSLTKLSYVGEAGTRDFIIGDKAGKAYSLVSVFLHEGGHFLGLPHLPREDLWSESIWTAMLSRVRPETCLSMMETTMLNSAADLGWLNRAKKCEGLLRTETEDK